MSRYQSLVLLAVGFAVGAIVGAGSLWLFTNDSQESTAAPISNTNPVAAEAPEPQDVVVFDPEMITVEYEITTDGMSVTHLSYVDVIDGMPEMVEKLGTPPPFRHVIQVPKSEKFDLETLSVTGMGAATSTTTTCTLRVDGERVARQTADGTYALVNCEISDSDE